MEKIQELMLREHGKILSLLASFESSRTEEDFNKLKEKENFHVLAEEKAIFIFDSKHKTFPVLTEIMKQHSQLSNILESIKESFNRGDIKPLIKDLKELMKKHIALEDRDFYPILDNKLDTIEQEKILNRAKQYILGNIAA